MYILISCIVICIYLLMFRYLKDNNYIKNYTIILKSTLGSLILLYGYYISNYEILLQPIHVIFLLTAFGIISTITAIDLAIKKIPNACIVTLIFINLGISFMDNVSIIDTIKCVSFCTIIYLIYHIILPGLGAGDVKFIFALSLIFDILVTSYFNILVMTMILIILFIRHNSKNSFPLGPVFYIALCFAYFIKAL